MAAVVLSAALAAGCGTAPGPGPVTNPLVSPEPEAVAVSLAAGAPAGAVPVLSTSLMAHAGRAYTVAAMGPARRLRLAATVRFAHAPPHLRVDQSIPACDHLTAIDGRLSVRDMSSLSRRGAWSPGSRLVLALRSRQQPALR
jgi:hypothetical protein